MAINSMSSRGVALLRTFAAAFEAAKEHDKLHPHEVQMINESIAAHLRSSAPLSMTMPIPDTGPVPRFEPEALPSGGMSVQLEDGSWYELIRAERQGGQVVRMYVRDGTAHDVVLMLSPARAEELRVNVARVLAAIGAKR